MAVYAVTEFKSTCKIIKRNESEFNLFFSAGLMLVD
jgi:hypothetical protein